MPARDILARADVHISHGGNNSVHECLMAGVPMVFVPQAYDQFPLAGQIDLLGAGRVTDEDPVAIRDAVRWLLEDEAPQARAREFGRHLVEFDGEGRVAAVVSRYSPTARRSARSRGVPRLPGEKVAVVGVVGRVAVGLGGGGRRNHHAVHDRHGHRGGAHDPDAADEPPAADPGGMRLARVVAT